MEQEFGAQVQMVLLVQAVCQILITLICTWWSLMDLRCANPEICHCVTSNYAEHYASSCACQ